MSLPYKNNNFDQRLGRVKVDSITSQANTLGTHGTDDWVSLPTSVFNALDGNATLGTLLVEVFKYKISDQVLHVQWNIHQSVGGGAAGAGTYGIQLPTSLPIQVSGTVNDVVGRYQLTETGTNDTAFGSVTVDSGGSNRLVMGAGFSDITGAVAKFGGWITAGAFVDTTDAFSLQGYATLQIL